MEETLYFDYRPSTGYNGYYKVYIDSIPEEWTGSLSCDSDWVTIYKYDRNRYNILVAENVSLTGATEERTCNITGTFNTKPDSLYDGSASENVVIHIIQSGMTLPTILKTAPISLTVYQNSDKSWSYIIDNYSDEVSSFIQKLSVSIMYSVSDGITRYVETDDISSSGDLSGITTDIILNDTYGFPVVSINANSEYTEVLNGQRFVYAILPSVRLISLSDQIYDLDIQCASIVPYNAVAIDVTVVSNGSGVFGIYKKNGRSYSPIVSQEFIVDNDGVEQTFNWNLQFSPVVSPESIETYLISGTTTALFGNATKTVIFERDIKRYINFGIKKKGTQQPFDFDGNYSVGRSEGYYNLTYETNYTDDNGYVKFTITTRYGEPFIRTDVSEEDYIPFDELIPLSATSSGSMMFFKTIENGNYGSRNATITATCYDSDGNVCGPSSYIFITQPGSYYGGIMSNYTEIGYVTGVGSWDSE